MNAQPKVALVTGGASGLGFAIAEKFVKSGIRTIIVGRNVEKLQEAQQAFGELCAYESCDLSNLSEIPGLVNRVQEKWGRIDILVNNAGINQKKPFVEVSDEDFQRILLTNVTSIFSLSREVVKLMLQQGGGSIVNISSMAAQYGLPKVIAYTASKSAIEGMTRAMASELSAQGIRINCVAPGFIATNMSATALNSDPERKQKVMSRTPMGKLGTPADIGEAVYYLASDAASYVTGAILVVDGGNSIGF